jgi:hypothetical protein
VGEIDARCGKITCSVLGEHARCRKDTMLGGRWEKEERRTPSDILKQIES